MKDISTTIWLNDNCFKEIDDINIAIESSKLCPGSRIDVSLGHEEQMNLIKDESIPECDSFGM